MSNQRDDLLTIGAFAKRSRLSLKALRVYDEMGLLPPAMVDPHNGYRYYQPDQLEPARLIGLLRTLEMALAQIAEVLEMEAGAASKSIAAYWQEVESDHRTKRKLVRYLRNYLESKGERMFNIETRHVGEQKVVSIERTMLARSLPDFISESMSRLYDRIFASGAAPDGPPFVIYHSEVTNDSEGPVEVCVPFTGDVEPEADIRLRVEPAREEAYTRISKREVAFPGILEAFDSVDKWISEQNLEMAASPREVYFADWNAIGPDDPACDITFPIRAPK